ncbi:hypothetical protein AX16_008129 [Volvariella volvacea WC 439]|nr:hypothetical protein AX16_008129 [Volvariella volvacea WC 439]
MSRPVYLKNGEQVKVNDHVYCSPSWAVRDGTPYSVARIMQFLPPEDAPKGKEGENCLYTRVRLAWYYRPCDVSDRPVADSRLLLAAIYSEVCDINQLRAKCHVVHRDKISDLAGWKKRPDRFYFNRLFDPYIKKEFEIIQSTDVRNLPDHIRSTLISRYEYVVAEKEVIPALTDTYRACEACRGWCSPSHDTLQCHHCKDFYHMTCISPPVSAKPTRGYAWSCAPCSRRHEEEVDSHEIRHNAPIPTKPKSNAPAPRGRGRPRKDRTQAEKEENLPIKHFNMWPFRYFGQYTVPEDTLDPDDLIFPRIATRQGAKYQALVPSAPEPAAADIDDRGGDDTVEVLGNINSLTSAEIDEVETCIKELADVNLSCLQSVDWMTEVVRRFSDAATNLQPFSSVEMDTLTRVDKWKKQENPILDRPWSEDERRAFQDAITANRGELRAVRDAVNAVHSGKSGEQRRRSMPEVVRFYGHWKNSLLGEENKRILAHGTPQPIPIRQFKDATEANDGQHVGLSEDEEGSIVAQPSKSPLCGACRTRESKIWWKAPKGLQTDVLCDACGTNWRKYADLNVRPFREESLPKTKATTVSTMEKREGTPLAGPSTKRAKTSLSAQTTPTIPPQNVPQICCRACLRSGPLGKVLKCKQCDFCVHAGSYGTSPDPTDLESWVCELCQNMETQEASVHSDCLLCPRAQGSARLPPYPPPNSFLRACKPTEGQGWAHVLCAVFTPDLIFTDASRLRLVEKISLIPRRQWATRCSICGKQEGAVIRCSDCPKEFHISCAWNQGARFGFEIQPVSLSPVNFDSELMGYVIGEEQS